MRGPCQRKLVCGKVVEADAEGEPALRGGVELLDEVGRADEGQRVACPIPALSFPHVQG